MAGMNIVTMMVTMMIMVLTMILMKMVIMIKIVNQTVWELLRVKLLLGIPIEPKSTCPQKRYNTSEESKVGGKHF